MISGLENMKKDLDMVYTGYNIDSLLQRRYIGQKIRRGGASPVWWRHRNPPAGYPPDLLESTISTAA